MVTTREVVDLIQRTGVYTKKFEFFTGEEEFSERRREDARVRLRPRAARSSPPWESA